MEMKRLRECLMGMPAGNAILSGDMGGLEAVLLRHQTTASSIILDGQANDA